ncbi:MAG TPA: hypothetical protein DCE56_29540 [Cyanobacteria bacterium UBA8553]|nr:hypothetical protein [Cyanobacteria bacterium UBA8553]
MPKSLKREKLRKLIPLINSETIVDCFESDMRLSGYFVEKFDKNIYSPTDWLEDNIDDLSEETIEQVLEELTDDDLCGR